MAFDSNDWINSFMDLEAQPNNTGMGPHNPQLQQDWTQPPQATTASKDNNDNSTRLIVIETMMKWIYDKVTGIERDQSKILDKFADMETKLNWVASVRKQGSSTYSEEEKSHADSDLSVYSDSSSEDQERVADILGLKGFV